MNDESTGIAGWLLADLVLVLAIVFLAFAAAAVSAEDDPPQPPRIAAPVILDIGCITAETGGRIGAECVPTLGGGATESYEWEAERGQSDSDRGGGSFRASFADAGAVRLTVSNAGGEHSAAFPVIPPPAPTAETTLEPPLIRDLGCIPAEAEGQVNVRCEPDLGGGEPSSYAWEAERGSPRSSERGTTFSASFEPKTAGAVRLIVANARGEARAEFAVLPPPTPTPEPMPTPEPPSATLVLEDFRFDQIVFCGTSPSQVNWEQIAAGRVREDVSKAEELSGELCEGTDGAALAFLRTKQQEGFRIAMVETFSNLNGTTSTLLSARVNQAFRDGLSKAAADWLPPGADLGDIFVACSPGERWFAEYFDRGELQRGEVRINIFFVRRNTDVTCP